MWSKNYRLQSIQLSKSPIDPPRGAETPHGRFEDRRPLTNRAGGAVEANAGGEYRDRTGDLLVANQALSQLS